MLLARSAHSLEWCLIAHAYAGAYGMCAPPLGGSVLASLALLGPFLPARQRRHARVARPVCSLVRTQDRASSGVLAYAPNARFFLCIDGLPIRPDLTCVTVTRGTTILHGVPEILLLCRTGSSAHDHQLMLQCHLYNLARPSAEPKKSDWPNGRKRDVTGSIWRDCGGEVALNDGGVCGVDAWRGSVPWRS